MASERRAWSREDTIRAYLLYCQTPFGQIHHRTLSLIALAKELGRTPSSIAYKLANFAHLDPSLSRKGMSNVSALDREVVAQFSGNWERSVWAAVPAGSLADEFPIDVPTEALRSAKVRLTQSFFRSAVLSSYDFTCCACGVDARPLLTASHIKPWAVDAAARSNPRNGLALCALHDRAFDRGLMTVYADLTLGVSSILLESSPVPVIRAVFVRLAGRTIRRPNKFLPDELFLRYHRERVFKA